MGKLVQGSSKKHYMLYTLLWICTVSAFNPSQLRAGEDPAWGTLAVSVWGPHRWYKRAGGTRVGPRPPGT